ncbi:hypothetical protein TNIN_105171 [Trichonephila inaurata madagascariensis]|uniref:Uncharacterized protein n=1 Tax=Trichonephila inaurata madagascariensis TaxID=2747483 RepID=A0A8X6Y670_9ARAC|nr:hypothetical protein TNIN_105171 [Trichonephila inaurata madagascariensis]
MLLTLFIDNERMVHTKIMAKETTITTSSYSETLKTLPSSHKNRQPGELLKFIVFMIDNARPFVEKASKIVWVGSLGSPTLQPKLVT